MGTFRYSIKDVEVLVEILKLQTGQDERIKRLTTEWIAILEAMKLTNQEYVYVKGRE
jgi:hypothetical protein